MHFYHVDRKNTLRPNTILKPKFLEFMETGEPFKNDRALIYNNGLSSHGLLYLTDNEALTPNFCFNTLFEVIIENVRLSYFPEKKSRFEAFFAFKTKEDASIFLNSNTSLYKVETEDFFEADMAWLDSNKVQQSLYPNCKLSVSMLEEFAYRYWAGEKTNSPVIEVLCYTPVKVLEQVLF